MCRYKIAFWDFLRISMPHVDYVAQNFICLICRNSSHLL